MSSAQFNYKDNIFSSPTFGDWMSDVFLGTSNTQNKNNTALLNYQMQFNEHMQDKANAFNERMSSTAYQRAMADMEKAGINPMVAFSKGASPASSPSSAMSSSPGASAPKPNYLNSILGKSTAKLVNSVMDKALRSTIDRDLFGLDVLNTISKFMP